MDSANVATPPEDELASSVLHLPDQVTFSSSDFHTEGFQENGHSQSNVELPYSLVPEEPGPSNLPQDQESLLQGRSMFESHKIIKKEALRVVRRHSTLQPLRQHVQLRRDRADYEWESRHHQRRHLKDSQEAFMRELGIVMRSLPPNPAFTQLRVLYQHVLDDQSSLDDQVIVSRNIEDEVSSLQYRLMKKEASFSRAVQKLINLVDSDLPTTSSPVESLVGSESVGQTKSLPEMDPLLAEYYDRIADFNMLRDRIAELELDHEEEQIGRELRADRDEPVEDPEEAFDATYSRALQAAQQAMGDALLAADFAKAACANSGLNVENPGGFDGHTAGMTEAGMTAPASPDLATTPSTLALGFPVMTTNDLQLSGLDDRIDTSMMLTSTAEPLSGNTLPLLRRKDLDISNQTRIEDWVQDTVPCVGDEAHDIGPYQRTATHARSMSTKSLPTLRTDQDSHVAKQLAALRSRSEQYHLSVNLTLGSHSASSLVRRESESGLSGLRSRHDSHQDVLEDLKTNRP